MHHSYYRILHHLKNNMTDLYIMHSIRGLAISLFSIFIPIYLIQTGLSYVDVGIYLFVHYASLALFASPSLKIISKIGLKQSFVFSAVLKIFFIITLYLTPLFEQLFPGMIVAIILAIMLSISDSQYWMTFHVEFMKFSSRKKGGKQIGIMDIASSSTLMLAPLIGALIIVNVSYAVTFLVIAILLIIATIPIFFAKESYEPFKFKTKLLNHKHSTRYFLEGLYSPATAAYWPLLLYILFSSLTTTGMFYTISTIAYLVVTYFVSHTISEVNHIKILLIGTLGHGASLILKAFSTTIPTALASQTLGALTAPFFFIPYHKEFYLQAKHENHANHIFMREIYLNFGRCISNIILILGFIFFEPQTGLMIALIVSGLALPLINIKRKTAYWKIKKKKK